MGKNASKNFVNQFKNTRRQAGRRPLVGQAGLRAAAPLWGQAGRRPLVGQAHLEQRKLVKNPARQLKKFLPGERKNEKNPNRGDK